VIHGFNFLIFKIILIIILINNMYDFFIINNFNHYFINYKNVNNIFKKLINLNENRIFDK
jgi:hypothetical protein